MNKSFLALSFLLFSGQSYAAQNGTAMNWTVIAMFSVVVLITLFITWRAARRTHSKEDFYTDRKSVV